MADQNKDSTNQEATEENVVYLWKIPFDKDFIKSLPSVFKIGAAVLSFIAFCCVASGRTDDCDDDYSSTYNYFESISISAFLTMVISWLFFALTIATKRFFRIIPWMLGDLIILAVFILLYVIANIVLAAQDCGKDSFKAGAAFGFFAMFCLVGNIVISGRVWWAKRNTNAAEKRTSQEYNAERNMEQY